MRRDVRKVLAYVTRDSLDGFELLVFKHRDFPEAGIQVPAGTVQPGESLYAAVLREIKEESGLVFTKINKHLGDFEWLREDRNELHLRSVFHIESSSPIADTFLHRVSGIGEDSSMIFDFYWLRLNQAKTELIAHQGDYIHLLQV